MSLDMDIMYRVTWLAYMSPAYTKNFEVSYKLFVSLEVFKLWTLKWHNYNTETDDCFKYHSVWLNCGSNVHVVMLAKNGR